jgi:hypothetical protein
VGPIQNLCTPDVGGIQNLESTLAAVLFEALGNDLFDFIAAAKAVGRIRNLLKRRQIQQFTCVGRCVMASARSLFAVSETP